MKLYKIGYSKINNKGLFANKDIKKGTRIINYVGKIITKKVEITPIKINEFEGDLLLSTKLNHLDFGKIESLDMEKINLEAVAIQATAQAKIAITIKKRVVK